MIFLYYDDRSIYYLNKWHDNANKATNQTATPLESRAANTARL